VFPRLLLLAFLACATAAGTTFGAQPTKTVVSINSDGVRQNILLLASAVQPHVQATARAVSKAALASRLCRCFVRGVA